MELLSEPGDHVASEALRLSFQLNNGVWYHNALSSIGEMLTGSGRRRAVEKLVDLAHGDPARLKAAADRLRARRMTGTVRAAIRLLEQATFQSKLPPPEPVA